MDCSAYLNGDVVQLRYLECVFANFVGILLGLAGILFFLMFIAGGYKFITSGGDPKGIESAKKTLTYAIGGIVVVALSYLIIYFIEVFTGASITDFVIFREN